MPGLQTFKRTILTRNIAVRHVCLDTYLLYPKISKRDRRVLPGVKSFSFIYFLRSPLKRNRESLRSGTVSDSIQTKSKL